MAYKAQEIQKKKSPVRRMDVIIAIKLGISHTSNVCMINYNQPKDCEEFNVVFDTNYKLRQ